MSRKDYAEAVQRASASYAEAARKNDRLYELMEQIADEAARADVCDFCLTCDENDLQWWRVDTSLSPTETTRALEYLNLRGLIEYDGKLVRFVEEGK